MNEEEKQARIWNMNAHFAWSLAMWGSGEHARNIGSTLLASVGHYYSTFHAGFSVACTDHTINLKDYEHVDHGTVHRWTKRLLGDEAGERFDRLRRMREALNYMGVGDPLSKFQLVRGTMAGFDFDGTKVSFEEALATASSLSRGLVSAALDAIEVHGRKERWPGPRRGDTAWQDEYLQEDLLRTVFTTHEARKAVLGFGFGLLK